VIEQRGFVAFSLIAASPAQLLAVVNASFQARGISVTRVERCRCPAASTSPCR
jgi:hypothetical protein